MTKTSHKKNRPFDFKLIDLVEPHPVLYLRQIPGMSSFEVMKTKNNIWQQIALEMGQDVKFCLSRWNNLRGQFQKELRHCTELCPKSGKIRGSSWPYLERLRFLEHTLQYNKPKKPRLSKRKQEELQQMQDDWNDDDKSENMDKSSDIEIHNIQDMTPPIGEEDNPVTESYTEDSDYGLIEEVVEEVMGPDSSTMSPSNLEKIEALLFGFEGENRNRVERRITAFLCKCQLRILSQQDIDDLYL
uniref:MADF domain-containing protein n=1 Tax=Glossina brevipalpis TaxID=37001 RepID=A0A1A9WT84_9MUSC